MYVCMLLTTMSMFSVRVCVHVIDPYPPGLSPLICVSAGRRPKLCDFEYLEDSSGTHSVKIIKENQGMWQALIGHFCLPRHSDRAMQGMCGFSPDNACMEVFRQWLEGGNKDLTPKNGNTVIKTMCHIGKSELADQIHKLLVIQ